MAGFYLGDTLHQSTN